MSLNTYLTNVLGSALRGEQQGTRPVPRWLPAAIVMDMVLLALLLVAAVTLLVLAWRHGW